MRGEHINPGNRGEVHAEEPVQMRAQVEVWLVAARLSTSGGRGGCTDVGTRVRQRREVPLDLDIALGHELLVVAVGVQRLSERKDMLRPVIAPERLCDGLRCRVDAPVAQRGERRGVTFAGENRVDDRESGHPGDVADHVMQLQIHLVQRLLHALDMRRGRLDQALTMPEQRAQTADVLRRPKRGGQQAACVQILQPLAVGDVRLPTGHVFHVVRVDEAHLKPARFEDLEERDPEHAGRLHRDCADTAGFEPVGERVEILRKRLELTNRSGIAFGVDCHVDTAGTDVDARRISTELSRTRASRFPRRALGRIGPPGWKRQRAAQVVQNVSLLNGIVRPVAARHH